jgi:GT2 family glycosyltransferase
MPSAAESVSVVIPSWNGAEILKPTLDHLAKLEKADFEVLVVDHGRLNRDTEKLVKDFSEKDARIKYLGLDDQLGFAGAVNYGTAKAAHKLVAVICNDVLVEKSWLAELLKSYEENARGGKFPIVTSLVTRPGFEPLKARMNLWGRIVETGEVPRKEDYIPFFPDGSAFLFDRDFYGLPFDSEYFLYQEDVYLGWRAWLMGESVVLAPKSNALNADGGTTKRTPYMAAFFTERNRWLNYFTFFSLGTMIRAMPLLKADALLRLVAGSNRLAKLHAWAWLLLHPVAIGKKRWVVQKKRKRRDREILPLIARIYVEGNGRAAAWLNRAVRIYVAMVRLRLAN